MSSPPDPKRPKLSSSPDQASERAPVPVSPSTGKARYKRRKVALFFGYCGAGYQGMQKNPGARTIEADLEEALFLSWAVPEADRGNPRRCDWSRSARTDKGVSALGQVVAGRFYVEPEGLVERLNSHLDPQIRVFGFKRVTGSFNAKKFCDRRRYVYLLPLFALDPEKHCTESEREDGVCLECAEKGYKIAWYGRHEDLEGEGEGCLGSDLGGLDVIEEKDVGVSSNGLEVTGGNGIVTEPTSECASSVGREHTEAGNEVSAIEETISGCASLQSCRNKTEIKSDEEKPVENVGNSIVEDVKLSTETLSVAGEVEPLPIVEEKEPLKPSKFHYGEKEKNRFNEILGRYMGTHNFHNFTSRTKAEDPSAQRYIVSFHANDVVSVDGVEFVKCEVVGQSFMLHQIRKMIGLAVAIMRNCTTESSMDSALKKDVKVNLPTAPEVGLYLDECLFHSYNKKWKDSHEALSMDSFAEQAEEFKAKHIHSHISSMEQKEGAMALWLHLLNHHRYQDPHSVETAQECNDG